MFNLDLRSGAQKSSVVPPKHPYTKRAMVVHTPSKLDVLRQTAAERRSTGAGVPPSVQAAGAQGAVAPACLLYTSPSPRDLSTSRMPSSA